MINRFGNTKTKLPTQYRSDSKITTLAKPKKDHIKENVGFATKDLSKQKNMQEKMKTKLF